MHKDIVQFMSVYSLTFPELDDKRANTLKAWERFDFTNLVFTVDKIQPIDPDNAIAWVTWYMDTKNRHTQELASVPKPIKCGSPKSWVNGASAPWKRWSLRGYPGQAGIQPPA